MAFGARLFADGYGVDVVHTLETYTLHLEAI
jgi:hypothetical protein